MTSAVSSGGGAGAVHPSPSGGGTWAVSPPAPWGGAQALSPPTPRVQLSFPPPLPPTLSSQPYGSSEFLFIACDWP